jgi:hypothetical protein
VGVQELYLKDFGGPPTQVVGFDIADILDRGWEDIQFRVEDYEHDRMRLLCKDIEVKSVERA